jgi:hypothetical protein
MKQASILFAVCFLCFSCNNSKPSATDVKTDSVTVKEKPQYPVPVMYSNWEIGETNHTATILNYYKLWDEQNAGAFESAFADTLILRLPEERNEIRIPNNQIHKELIANRSMYGSTANTIISAVPLHDRDSGEDWVMITTYNKWEEKNGKRDSAVFQDNWRLKNGKIYFLMSFQKRPTKELLKKLDPK